MTETTERPVTNQPAGGRRRTGCLAVLGLLLAGLVGAAIFAGPRLAALLTGPTAPIPAGPALSEQAAAYRSAATERLTTYGWVDRNAQVAHIPIDQAMALLAAEGLPVGAPADSAAGDAAGQAEPTIDLSNVSFQNDVLPIFEQHCSKCHGDDDPEEGLEVTRYAPLMAGSIYGSVVKPGDPDGSYLVEMVVSGKMPKQADDLSANEIATIIAWIEAGALDN